MPFKVVYMQQYGTITKQNVTSDLTGNLEIRLFCLSISTELCHEISTLGSRTGPLRPTGNKKGFEIIICDEYSHKLKMIKRDELWT